LRQLSVTSALALSHDVTAYEALRSMSIE